MNNLLDSPPRELYIAGVYFVVTTLVTVGYGDLTAKSEVERGVCCLFMVIGVLSYSYMTGLLTSLI
jgi:hypothetical protein